MWSGSSGLRASLPHPVSVQQTNAPGTASADPETVRAKLLDMETVGFVAEFDPDEAEMAGAFVEDALSDADAMASVIDRTDCIERTQWRKPAPPSTANDSDFNPTVDVF